MPSDNPYSTPKATLGDDQAATYEPKVFSFSGRIGRLRYLAYSTGTYLLLLLSFVPLFVSFTLGASDTSMSVPMLLFFGLILIAITVLGFAFAKRRLNDLDQSGWLSLLFIVPFISFLMTIYLLCFSGTAGANKFGPEPSENTVGVKILAWTLLVLIVLICILTAISMSEYQEYLNLAE